MKRHTNIIITAVASLLIVTLAGREFIKNHKKESNDKSSTNVSENTREDIPDTSISDTGISDTCVADTNTPDTNTSEADILDTTYENNKEQFYISEIPDDIFEKMQGKSYKADCTLPRENLRYIHVLHVGFDNQVHEGELVVNKDIADDVLEIFKELYESGYQIEKVRLVDEYDADDEASMSDNNSSAFNFRFIYSTLYKPCIFKAYRLLNVQTLGIFPCFCPYEPKQGKLLFSADYLIQQSCGSTLCFPCSVSVNIHCGTDISVSEKFLHIFRCCTV